MYSDKDRIWQQFLEIEYNRDFIIWLCEEVCNSTVTEMEAEFQEYLDKQEQNQTT